MFSTQHYRVVAKALRDTRPVSKPELDQWLLIQDEFEQVFAADNPRFDPTTFARACKHEEVVS